MPEVVAFGLVVGNVELALAVVLGRNKKLVEVAVGLLLVEGNEGGWI